MAETTIDNFAQLTWRDEDSYHGLWYCDPRPHAAIIQDGWRHIGHVRRETSGKFRAVLRRVTAGSEVSGHYDYDTLNQAQAMLWDAAVACLTEEFKNGGTSNAC